MSPLERAPRLLEVSHVAHRLSRSQKYVRQLIRDGKLKAVRDGKEWRVKTQEYDAYIQRCEEAALEAIKARRRPAMQPFPG